MEEKNLFQDIKDFLEQEVKQAFLDGAKTGAISTCRVIYTTFTKAGLAEDNILFAILKDIAKHNGCDDLATYGEDAETDSLSN